MEVPTATKVKVTDFFQRLVCGLLIFFHSHCCFFPTWWSVYSSSDMKRLWICVLDLGMCFFLNTQSVFFCYFWIQPTEGDSPGGFGTFEQQPIQSPILFPKPPGLSSKATNAKLTLTVNRGAVTFFLSWWWLGGGTGILSHSPLKGFASTSFLSSLQLL